MYVIFSVNLMLITLEFIRLLFNNNLKLNLNGKLLKQKFVFKKVNFCLQKTKSKYYFKTQKLIYYKINNTNYLKNFYLGFNCFINFNNKIIKLPNKFYYTQNFKNITINNKISFVNDKTIISSFYLKNYSTKPKNIKLCFKNYYNVETPSLNFNEKNKIVTLYYNNNFISVVAFNESSKLKQNLIIPYVQNCSFHYINVKLFPKQTKLIKFLLTVSLKNSTMQSIMQNNNFGFITNNYQTNNFNNYEQLFNYKYLTNDKQINYLINNFLPSKLKNLKLTCAELYNLIFFSNVNNLKRYSYKNIINWLLKRKEYCRLYNYILTCVLGIKPLGHIIKFEKQHEYLGVIVITYKNITIKKFNLHNSFYFLKNNIIYKNVNVVNLNFSCSYNLLINN